MLSIIKSRYRGANPVSPLRESIDRFKILVKNRFFQTSAIGWCFVNFNEFKYKYYERRIPLNISGSFSGRLCSLTWHSWLWRIHDLTDAPLVTHERDDSCQVAIEWLKDETVRDSAVPPSRCFSCFLWDTEPKTTADGFTCIWRDVIHIRQGMLLEEAGVYN